MNWQHVQFHGAWCINHMCRNFASVATCCPCKDWQPYLGVQSSAFFFFELVSSMFSSFATQYCLKLPEIARNRLNFLAEKGPSQKCLKPSEQCPSNRKRRLAFAGAKWSKGHKGAQFEKEAK